MSYLGCLSEKRREGTCSGNLARWTVDLTQLLSRQRWLLSPANPPVMTWNWYTAIQLSVVMHQVHCCNFPLTACGFIPGTCDILYTHGIQSCSSPERNSQDYVCSSCKWMRLKLGGYCSWCVVGTAAMIACLHLLQHSAWVMHIRHWETRQLILCHPLLSNLFFCPQMGQGLNKLYYGFHPIVTSNQLASLVDEIMSCIWYINGIFWCFCRFQTVVFLPFTV